MRGKWERASKGPGTGEVLGSYRNSKQASEVETKPRKEKKMENKIESSKRHGSEEQFYVFYAR